jgi:hypothetical protein
MKTYRVTVPTSGAFRMGGKPVISSNTPNLSAMRNIARVGTSQAQAAHSAAGGGGVNGSWPSTAVPPTSPASAVPRKVDYRTR